MNRKRFFISFIAIAILVFALEFAYLVYKKKMQEDDAIIKKAAVRIISLPDIALSTEARFIRHRSLSDVGSLFNEDGVLRDYFPSSFAYNAIYYNNPHSRIELEH